LNNDSTENVFSKLITTAKHVVVYGIGIILTRSFGFVLIPLYTKYLTPADYGILEILYRTADLVNIILATGLGVTIIRFYTLEEDKSDKNSVIATGISYTLVLGIILVGILYFQADLLSDLLYKSAEYVELVRIMLFFCLVETLFIIPMAYIQAQIKSTQFVTFSLMKFILGISLNIYMVAGLNMGVKGIMVANLVNGVVTSGLVVGWSLKQVGLTVKVALLKKMLKFSLPLVPGGLLMFVLNNGDRFFLQRFTNDTILGIYSLGYKFGSAIAILVLSPFNKVWAVYVFKIAKREDFKMLFPMIFRLLMFAYILIGLIFSIYSQEIVELFATEGYYEAFKVIPIVVLAYLLWTASTYFDLGFYITGKTVYKSVLVIVGAAVIIPLYWYLIPKYDMYGAAWATVGGFAAFSVTAWYLSRRIYYITYGLIRFGGLILLSSLFYLVAQFDFGLSSFVLFAYKLGLIICFPVVLYFLGYLTSQEKKLLGELILLGLDKIKGFRK